METDVEGWRPTMNDGAIKRVRDRGESKEAGATDVNRHWEVSLVSPPQEMKSKGMR